MKFTIAEWRMIQELVDAEYYKVRDAVNAMKREATPEGRNWPDEDKLNENPEYRPMMERFDMLTEIGGRLDQEEI